MDYYCEVCLKNNETKNKHKHFKSKSHLQFDKCKHILLSHKDIVINDVDAAFYLYIIEHNKKFDYYLINCEFDLVFNDYHYCPYVTSNLSDNKTMILLKNCSKKVIDDFKDKRYNFIHIAEMHIITYADKMDMSYDIYIEQTMHALEWK